MLPQNALPRALMLVVAAAMAAVLMVERPKALALPGTNRPPLNQCEAPAVLPAAPPLMTKGTLVRQAPVRPVQ